MPAKRGAGDLAVVERMDLAGDLLALLVALAGDQHHPTGVCVVDRGLDRRATVEVDLDVGRDLYGCDLALIRPDHYVAWRGNRAPDDADALIAHVTGH
jgi:hypothetical protein